MLGSCRVSTGDTRGEGTGREEAREVSRGQSSAAWPAGEETHTSSSIGLGSEGTVVRGVTKPGLLSKNLSLEVCP